MPETTPMSRLRWVRVGVLAFLGAVLAVQVAGRVSPSVGPFDTTASARLSLRGQTVLHLAPLGTITLDTHSAPVAIDLRVDELRLAEAEAIARDPSRLEGFEDDLASDARGVLTALAVRTLLVGLLGGVLGALLARAALRPALVGLGVAALVVGGTIAGTALTFRADAVAEPRYSGVLTVAPTAVGNVKSIANRFGEYRAQLTGLVGNVVDLYRAAQGLPRLATGDDTIRVLHVSDIHNSPQGFDLARKVVEQFDIDVVADTGDLTDWGTAGESQLLAQIGGLGVPYVWVRGNHDSPETQAAVAAQPNAVVLDGDAAEVGGLRFWGIGDPRFTPDKDQPTGKDVEREQAEAFAPTAARRLRADATPAIDVALVHDQRMAAGLGGLVPLVLAGHTHHPRQGRIGASLLLVEGSTGGAGLRALTGAEPEPLTCSILYFDGHGRRLVAYDRISVDGIGGAGVRIERHAVAPPSPQASTTTSGDSTTTSASTIP